ncbi:hypothetical protein AVEN_180139-1 [Araneus ventricosus]|uniref:Uncharacterized protein n=1 Tax=Araneus ventricosus TaxID=182803 RepID=A0A4Y2D6J3_ARAVE|nr:hypothetical protein AVEN_180139-1 [Araneus ventricosus]
MTKKISLPRNRPPKFRHNEVGRLAPHPPIPSHNKVRTLALTLQFQAQQSEDVRHSTPPFKLRQSEEVRHSTHNFQATTKWLTGNPYFDAIFNLQIFSPLQDLSSQKATPPIYIRQDRDSNPRSSDQVTSMYHESMFPNPK